MALRFQDTGETLYSFQNERLVVCPICSGCARICNVEIEGNAAEIRLNCGACHHVRVWNGWRTTQFQAGELDGTFGLSLWLQTPCCGEVLWAYNAAHLLLLERFVSAQLRSRDIGLGCRNASLISRLPAWIKSKKHRPEVLKAIARLNAKLN
jgi:hypothetical protein